MGVARSTRPFRASWLDHGGYMGVIRAPTVLRVLQKGCPAPRARSALAILGNRVGPRPAAPRTIRRAAAAEQRGRLSCTRMRPTHFLAFRLPDAALHAHLSALQQQIIRRAPDLAPCAVPAVRTHLTCFTLDLATDGEVDSASRTLREVSASRSAPRDHTRVSPSHEGHERVCPLTRLPRM